MGQNFLRELLNPEFSAGDSKGWLSLLEVWSVDYIENDEYCRDLRCKGVDMKKHRYMVITGEFMFNFLLTDSKLIVEEKKFYKLLPSTLPKNLTDENAKKEMRRCLEEVAIIAEQVHYISADTFLFGDVEELSIFRYVRKK